MKALKIFKSMIDHLNLLLHHRHSPGKVVMLPDLPGQLLHLGFQNRLGPAVGNEHTDQSNASGDHGCNNGFQILTSYSTST